MTVLHATEPATPYLSLFARIDSFTRADLELALFESKSLVKQLAMRRTLFVFPRDLLPAAVSSASARIAGQEYGRLVKDLERGQVTDDGAINTATIQTQGLTPLVATLSPANLRLAVGQLNAQSPQTPTTVFLPGGGEFGRAASLTAADGGAARGRSFTAVLPGGVEILVAVDGLSSRGHPRSAGRVRG